jgi:hypothetical protein
MRKTAGSFVRQWSTLALAGFAALVQSTALSPAYAVGKFISAPDRVDIAYDDSRGLLYITSRDEMLCYQLTPNRSRRR